mmetsp:Transcript_44430/g.71311  ORF Transcript_44430/g.71311 Transcript_44430/m.71311 type:complete len:301 (-) Transcript_44430:60-962(-)
MKTSRAAHTATSAGRRGRMLCSRALPPVAGDAAAEVAVGVAAAPWPWPRCRRSEVSTLWAASATSARRTSAPTGSSSARWFSRMRCAAPTDSPVASASSPSPTRPRRSARSPPRTRWADPEANVGTSSPPSRLDRSAAAVGTAVTAAGAAAASAAVPGEGMAAPSAATGRAPAAATSTSSGGSSATSAGASARRIRRSQALSTPAGLHRTAAAVAATKAAAAAAARHARATGAAACAATTTSLSARSATSARSPSGRRRRRWNPSATAACPWVNTFSSNASSSLNSSSSSSSLTALVWGR